MIFSFQSMPNFNFAKIILQQKPATQLSMHYFKKSTDIFAFSFNGICPVCFAIVCLRFA